MFSNFYESVELLFVHEAQSMWVIYLDDFKLWPRPDIKISYTVQRFDSRVENQWKGVWDVFPKIMGRGSKMLSKISLFCVLFYSYFYFSPEVLFIPPPPDPHPSGPLCVSIVFWLYSRNPHSFVFSIFYLDWNAWLLPRKMIMFYRDSFHLWSTLFEEI